MGKIPENILKLTTSQGFVQYYFSICLDFDTNKQAYEAAEQLYFDWFKKRRYSDYESFRVVKNRNLKKQ